MPYDYENLVVTVHDQVATVELDRPEAMNAITTPMVHELIDVFAATDADPDVRVVVVTGRGRAYCAGADLSGGADALDAQERGWGDDVEDYRDTGGLIALAAFRSTKPIIGAVNGVAAGLGATMLLPMDVVVASESARFAFVFTRRGIVPEACSTWFLPRKVGIGTAAEWMLTGRTVSAAEAREAGLVRSVHPAEELLDAAYAIAREIVENTAPVAVGLVRQMLWRFAGSPHPMDAHRVDSRLNFELGGSADVAEGIASFLEKRPPRFPGRMPQDAPTSYPWWDEPAF